MNQAKILKYTKYRTENKRTDPITPAHKQHSQANTHKVSLWIHFSVSVCCLVFFCVCLQWFSISWWLFHLTTMVSVHFFLLSSHEFLTL